MTAPVEEMNALFAACRGESAPEVIRNYLSAWLPLSQRYYEYLKLVQIDLSEFGGANIQCIFPQLATSQEEFVVWLQGLPGAKPMPAIALMRLLDVMTAGYAATARYGPQDARSAFTPDQWVNRIVDALLYRIADERT
jgi:hypothetical protein